MADRFPCGVCKLDCVGNQEIYCDACDTWFHSSCENLTSRTFNVLNLTSLPYSCSLCNYDRHTNKYKFYQALQRLSSASDLGLLDEGVKVELIYMHNELKTVASSNEPVTFSHLVQDSVATDLLGQNWDLSVPVSVNADGNCLFNALSIALCGNEQMATEISQNMH